MSQATAERNAEMAQMRRAGQTLAEIGDHFGLTRERVRQLVGDVEITGATCEQCGSNMDSAARRFCSDACVYRAHKKGCIDCGAAVGPKSERCVDCAIQFHTENRKNRNLAVQELWATGMPQKEMALKLGYAPGSLSVQMARAKHEGFEFPPRLKGWKGHTKTPGAPTKKPKTHAQVVARMQHAIRTGRLVRAESCERCGRVGPVDGHHHDYDKSLDVEWLCRPCHMQHHSDERRALKAAA